MSWLNFVKRDPVPWLLDPANPSARLLTLRDIFRRPEIALAREYAAVLAWEPLRALIAQAHPVNFWGRADNPTFGGPAGTLGTLYALAQLGIPAFPLAQEACENLLRHGRLPDGRFAPADSPAPPWLCYTGMALQTLWHFGFGEDPRTHSAQAALVQAVLHHPRQLECPIAGGKCPWGMVKALAGLLNTPPEQQTAEGTAAIEALAGQLLAHTFDFTGRDAAWMDFYFPRYYEADLVELCHVLAQSYGRDNPRFRRLVRQMVELQTEKGRWVQARPASRNVLPEQRNHPSRWLTFEAVHTLILTYGGNDYAP